MATMKAAVLTKLGDVPYYGTYDMPAVTDGEVLVKVIATSLKQLDRAIVAGTHYGSPNADLLPVVVGTDGVGITDNGERVYYQTTSQKFGSMAEYAPASFTVKIPDELDSNFVATLINPTLGAWLPLVWRAKMMKGETVLVIGATGETGKQALAAAKILGAKKVIAAGRMKSGLMDLDADEYIDTDQDESGLLKAFQAVAQNGVDIVVDYLWGKPAELMIKAFMTKSLKIDETTAERGVRYVSVGALAGAEIALPSSIFRSSFLTLLGSGTGNFPPNHIMKEIIERILQEAVSGKLTVEYDAYPLSEVANIWASANKKRIVFNP